MTYRQSLLVAVTASVLLVPALGQQSKLAGRTSVAATAPADSAAGQRTGAIELLLSRARTLDKNGRTDLAAQAWKQVLLADPNNAESLAGLARFARMNGREEEAQQYLDRLRHVDVKASAEVEAQYVPDPQTRAKLEEAGRLAAAGRKQEAIAIYREVFGNNPPKEWALRYNEILASVPESQPESVANLRALVKAHPENSEYRLQLGRVLTWDERTRPEGMAILQSIHAPAATAEQARQAWRDALVWEKANPAYTGSMRDYLKRYDDSEMRGIVVELQRSRVTARTGPRPGTIAEQRGYAALHAGKLQEAEAQFMSALRVNPRSSVALSGMGFVRMKQEDFNGALDFFQRARAAGASSAAIRQAIETARFWKVMKDASAAVAAGKLDDAVSYYQQAAALRPKSVEALNGLAGARMQRGEYLEASQLYRRYLAVQPKNPDALMGLVRAELQMRQPQAALDDIAKIPRDVRAVLDQRIEWLALVASVNMAAGRDSVAERLMLEATKRNAQGPQMALLNQQFADLYLRQGQTQKAISLYERAVQLKPDSLPAWQGLIGAYLQIKNVPQASDAVRRMPQNTYALALKSPDFLEMLARIHIEQGQYEVAENVLRLGMVPDVETAPIRLRLQLARMYALKGNTDAAVSLFRAILDQQPDNVEAWMAYLSALHERGNDEVALYEMQRAPMEVQNRLEQDFGYLALAAAVRDRAGDSRDALRMLRKAQTTYELQRQPLPADLSISLAWALLHTGDNDTELYQLLQRLATRRDLTAAMRRGLSDIWCEWSIKRAEAAYAGGDAQRAMQILQAAIRTYPEQPHLRSALGGILLKQGDYKRAYEAYSAWGLRGAEASDYYGAIGAAMALDHGETVDKWLALALRLWPRDPRVLEMAGKRAASRGDFAKAEQYWKAALAVMSDPSDAPMVGPGAGTPMTSVAPALRAPTNSVPGGGPQDDLSNLLSPNGATLPRSMAAQTAAVPLPPLPPLPQGRDRSGYGDPLPMPQGLRRDAVESGDPLPPLPGTTSDDASLRRQDIQEEIASIKNRNTPYFGTDVNFGSRSGQPGYDKLVMQETEIQASTILANTVRVTGIVRPTILDAGTPNANATWRMGTLQSGAIFDSPSAAGLGGEVQASTRVVGGMIGVTPSSFLIRDVIWGARFSPWGGPVSVMVYREPVKDTMLSFAGMRDPGTGLVWGGVVATGGMLGFNRSSVLNGIYGHVGYQSLRGKVVEDNTRLDATAGVWWRVAKYENAHLTVGVNVTGMHYDHNLRGFSLGMGGYFSPQSYALFSIPLEYAGTYDKNLEYSAKMSLGLQYFHENSNAMFPLSSPADQAKGPWYAARTSTGANFSIDLRGGYHISPNWIAGIFVAGNNTYQYTNIMGGIYLRYLFRPMPLMSDSPKANLPDWRGIDPISKQLQ